MTGEGFESERTPPPANPLSAAFQLFASSLMPFLLEPKFCLLLGGEEGSCVVETGSGLTT